MVLEPWILFPGLLSLVLAARRGLLVGHWYWVAWAFLLVAAHWGTRFRQEKALESFLEQADTAIFPASALHVVAHSFGTYLFVRALRDPGPMKVNRIVLTGCILSEEFDWKALLRSKEKPFQAIRNDVGRNDLPVFLGRPVMDYDSLNASGVPGPKGRP